MDDKRRERFAILQTTLEQAAITVRCMAVDEQRDLPKIPEGFCYTESRSARAAALLNVCQRVLKCVSPGVLTTMPAQYNVTISEQLLKDIEAAVQEAEKHD